MISRKSVFQNEPGSEKEAIYGEIGFVGVVSFLRGGSDKDLQGLQTIIDPLDENCTKNYSNKDFKSFRNFF